MTRRESVPVRSVLAAIVLLGLAPACGGAPGPPVASAQAAGEAQKEIGTLLDDWHEAAARAQEARYFSHFAEGAVFLGTDPTERWKLEDFRSWAHPKFSNGKAWTFRSARRVISVGRGGDVAWFDEDLETKSLGAARGSGVMVRSGTDRRWRIAQYNLSITIPNEKLPALKKILGADD